MPPKRAVLKRPDHRSSVEQLEVEQNLYQESTFQVLQTLPDEIPFFSQIDEFSDQEEWAPSMIGVEFSTPIRPFSRRMELTPGRALREVELNEDETSYPLNVLNFADFSLNDQKEKNKKEKVDLKINQEIENTKTVQSTNDQKEEFNEKPTKKREAKSRKIFFQLKSKKIELEIAAELPGPSRIDTPIPSKLKPLKRTISQLEKVDEAGDSGQTEFVKAKRKKAVGNNRSPYPLRTRPK